VKNISDYQIVSTVDGAGPFKLEIDLLGAAKRVSSGSGFQPLGEGFLMPERDRLSAREGAGDQGMGLTRHSRCSLLVKVSLTPAIPPANHERQQQASEKRQIDPNRSKLPNGSEC
jgi:hypothetical protein